MDHHPDETLLRSRYAKEGRLIVLADFFRNVSVALATSTNGFGGSIRRFIASITIPLSFPPHEASALQVEVARRYTTVANVY